MGNLVPLKASLIVGSLLFLIPEVLEGFMDAETVVLWSKFFGFSLCALGLALTTQFFKGYVAMGATLLFASTFIYFAATAIVALIVGKEQYISVLAQQLGAGHLAIGVIHVISGVMLAWLLPRGTLILRVGSLVLAVSLIATAIASSMQELSSLLTIVGLLKFGSLIVIGASLDGTSMSSTGDA